MLIETSQMQRLIITLGHPTYGLSVVLFAMLLSSGLGSYLTTGIDGRRRGGDGRGCACSCWSASWPSSALITPAVAHWSQPLTTAGPHRRRGGVCCSPPGCFMGMAFPLGMKLAAGARTQLTPWLWGLNGAASVLASVLSVCIALTWSISTAFWAGWACYLVALVAFAGAARRARVTEARTSQRYAAQS